MGGSDTHAVSRESAHFLLLLTPGALDRGEHKNAWVRREFETAVQHPRNIVPIREESDVTALRQTCPEAMRRVFDFQIATIRQDGFEDDIQDLIAWRTFVSITRGCSMA